MLLLRTAMALAAAGCLLAGCPATTVTDQDTGLSCDVAELTDHPACEGACIRRDDVDPCQVPDWLGAAPLTTGTCTASRGRRFAVVSTSDGAIGLDLYFTGTGALAAIAATTANGAGACSGADWFGEDLSSCLPDAAYVPLVCPIDTDVVVDTDTDTDTDVPDPGTCYLTPLESSGWCPDDVCVRPLDIDVCADPSLGPIVFEGTCNLGGVIHPVRRLTNASTGVTTSLYFTSIGQLTAVSADDNNPTTCKRWWGNTIVEQCELPGRTTLTVQTCPDTDVDTDTVDTEVVDTDETDLRDTASWDTTGPRPARVALPGDLVITEMMVDPLGCSDAFGEYIEVRNRATYPIDLTGLRLFDGTANRALITAPVVAPGARAVLFVSSPIGCFGYSIPFQGTYPWPPELKNLGGVLELRAVGTVIDRVDYTTWRKGYLGTVTLSGRALQVRAGFETATDNDDPANWCMADQPIGGDNHGSPGTVASACLPDIVDTGDTDGPDTDLADTDTDTDTDTGGSGICIRPGTAEDGCMGLFGVACPALADLTACDDTDDLAWETTTCTHDGVVYTGASSFFWFAEGGGVVFYDPSGTPVSLVVGSDTGGCDRWYGPVLTDCLYGPTYPTFERTCTDDTDTDVPDTDTDVPDTDTDVPDTDTDVPDTDTDVPDTDTDVPDTDTDVPDTDTDIPDTDTAGVDTDTDVVDTDVPDTDTDTP